MANTPTVSNPEGSQSKEPKEAESQQSPARMRWPAYVALIGLALGLAVEVLFYRQRLGISFPIWAGLSIAALFGAAALEGVRPSKPAFWLPLPILFYAAIVFVRAEPMTVALSLVATLALMAVWVRIFQTGDLLAFGWSDFAITLVVIPLESWFRPWSVISQAQQQTVPSRVARTQAMAVLRGLLLAFPILFILVALLSQADLVFGDRVEQALRWLDLERIADLMRRAFLIGIAGLFSLGAIAIALRQRSKRAGEGKPLIRPFVGFTETAVVLIGVNLIFALFVAIQVTYLFGGEANIAAAGYTYSEYARRGFGELVAVSVLSMGLIFALAMLTHRDQPGQKRALHALSAALVGFMVVILASALMRLLLYENAYGFTRLRTYTHVAIFWMAALFAAFLGMLLLGQLPRFALAAALAALGFTATLGLMNLDGFIVRQNAARLRETEQIDLDYLLQLSEDAVPGLVALLESQGSALGDDLAPELWCWHAQLRAMRHSWPAFHLARAQAERSAFTLKTRTGLPSIGRTHWGRWQMLTGGEAQLCIHQPLAGGP